MPIKELPRPWPQFLGEVDQKLSDAVDLHCVGGFVLTAVYGIPRSTGDLDYISVIPRQLGEELQNIAGEESPLAKKYRVFIHPAGGVTDLPENYEDRLEDLHLDLEKLRLRILDPYDLLLSKLTRNNPKDMEDVKALAKKLSLHFDVMIKRYESEMRVPNPRWHEQTLNVVWKEYFEN